MKRLSEDHFFQSHYIIGCRFPSFLDEENRLKTLLDWYEFMKNDDSDFTNNKSILNKVQSVDFIHFHNILDFRQILNDLHEIYIKSFPYSEITDFFDYTLSSTYYEIKALLENESRFIWAGYTFNNFHFYYYTNTGFEIEYFCLDENVDVENLFHYYRKVIKIIDDFIQSFSINNIEIKEEENSLTNHANLSLKNTPFVNVEHLKALLKLDEFYNEKDKKRYTQFYLYLNKHFSDFNIGQAKFFKYISENFETVAKRKQSTIYLEDIEELFNHYLNK